MAAVAGGGAASVRLLLKHGADANAQPGVDHAAFVFGGGRSPLMWAAFRGDPAFLKQLLDAGADVHSVGFLGSPLWQAAWGDRVAARVCSSARGGESERAATVSRPGSGRFHRTAIPRW
jgi:ankyrin repeat protein